jgi:DNA-binding transcriptional ArsR family regulator
LRWLRVTGGRGGFRLGQAHSVGGDEVRLSACDHDEVALAEPAAAHCVPLLLRTRLVTLGIIMDAVLQALADPSRRTVLETLRSHPATAGELAAALPIARPGVSRHLRVLREAGLVDVRQEAQRRVYSLRPEALVEVDQWLEPYRALWRNRLDALHTEVARGRKERR